MTEGTAFRAEPEFAKELGYLILHRVYITGEGRREALPTDKRVFVRADQVLTMFRHAPWTDEDVTVLNTVGGEILVADTPDEILQQMQKVLENPRTREAINRLLTLI